MSTTRDNPLTSTVQASNQSEVGPSRSRHPIEQAQPPQMNINQPDAEPSNSRQVTIGDLPIQDNNTGSPLSASPEKQLTQEEVQSKIDKYSTKISAYESNRMDKAVKGKQKASIGNSLKANQKKVSRYNQKILDQMLIITEQCNTKGYVYGGVTETGKSVTGASDSLREWWKKAAMFDKTAPAQIDRYYRENSLYSIGAEDNDTKSATKLLNELSDPTLGSILSLLTQHCDPPQRKFPFERGLPPPWWPTTQENWWGQTGISKDEGPPPFRKPHDLRKKWKVVVILGIIKSMSPNLSRPHSLVEQSRYLQLRMNAKETKFWTLALVSEAKQYCREYPNMPLDKAVEFLQAYGGSGSEIAQTIDGQNIAISGNEGPRSDNPSGAINWPPLTPPSTTPSAWAITGPPTGQQRQTVPVISTAPAPQLALTGSFPLQYSPWAFSYNPILPENVPLNLQHNHAIGGSGESSSGIQDHQAHVIVYPYPPFFAETGGASTGGTQDIQNQMPGGNVGFEFEHPFGDQNNTSGC